MDSEPKSENPVESDDRFPSGPWKGFFLQPVLPGRHWMELILTFRGGVMTGEGRDWVGRFIIRGKYEVDSGKCWFAKRYVGKHDVSYQGYNEGKGIWGLWELPSQGKSWRGGFHIWPVAMGDPTGSKLKAEADVPAPEPEPEFVGEPVGVGAAEGAEVAGMLTNGKHVISAFGF